MTFDSARKPRLLIIPGGGIGDHIISLPCLDFILSHFYSKVEIIIGDIKNTQRYKAIIGPERISKIDEFWDTIYGRDLSDFQGAITLDEFCKMTLTADIIKAVPSFQNTYRMNNALKDLFSPIANKENYPFTHYQLAELGNKMGIDRYTMPQYSLGINPKDYKQPTITATADIQHLGLPDYFITFNDGWNITGDQGRPTKAWPKEHWEKLMELLKQRGIKTIQLGSNDNGQRYDCDINLRGKTSFDETLSILKKSTCHIDIEGGLVHAATALGTKCIVMFGPTPVSFFGYQDNINLTHGACQNCFWLRRDWAVNCVAKRNNSCMQHSPELVAHHAVLTMAKARA